MAEDYFTQEELNKLFNDFKEEHAVTLFSLPLTKACAASFYAGIVKGIELAKDVYSEKDQAE